jgi:pilus assembly protein Flp/PilA
MLLLIWNYLETRVGEEDGATMVEYGLMVALIAVVVAVAATVLGTGIATLFTTVEGTL